MSEDRTVETRRQWIGIALACALCPFILASAGHALSQVEVDISGRTSAFSDPETIGGGLGSGDGGGGPLEISETRTDPIRDSTITATAIADFGNLRAMALASNHYSLPDQANAIANAHFYDSFSFDGPPGTVISLQYTSVLSGDCSTRDPNYCVASLFTYLSTYNGGTIPFLHSSWPDALTPRTGRLNVGVGQQVDLHVWLQVNAGARSDVVGHTDTLANFLNTGVLYIDVLTPGFSLVTASGHDYSTPVPEPSTLLLLGLGLVGLGAARHRGSERVVSGHLHERPRE